ncbi:Placenta growth factor [Labeo rohita]|uniref:Placenta growth factor n=1 Tax=Labeo rohita TaxID=84645 RepID=A0ABQ8LNY1_LABRO|nr:Placenta growth factor [Labeo rohita]
MSTQWLRFALLRLDMKRFICVSQLAAILLYIPLVQLLCVGVQMGLPMGGSQDSPTDEHPGPFSQVRFSAQTLWDNLVQKQGRLVSHVDARRRAVMLFHEAWGRSQCRSLERMVDVEQEYPGGVEHIYSPGCVPLLRCSGCCNDDKLACFPVSTRNISIQARDHFAYTHSLTDPHLLRITPADRSREYVLLSFQEHQSCECRPRRHHLRNQHRRRRKGKRRRRRRGRTDED